MKQSEIDTLHKRRRCQTTSPPPMDLAASMEPQCWATAPSGHNSLVAALQPRGVLQCPRPPCGGQGRDRDRRIHRRSSHLLDDVLSVAREALVELEPPRTTRRSTLTGIRTMSPWYSRKGNFCVS